MATTEQASELAQTLMQLHRQVRSALVAVASEFDLTVQQAEILCVLRSREPSFGELAALLGCDKTNITGLADRLARRELVDRYTDLADRRFSRLRLTERGHALEERIRAAMAVSVEHRWGSLSQPERAALSRLAAVEAAPQRPRRSR